MSVEFKEGQKIKVKGDHKFYPNREGYFRYLAGKANDCFVCSQHPVANGGWNVYFVVGANDLEEVK